MTTTATFTIGSTYEMTFIGDSELRPKFICTKRTPKTVTFKDLHDGEVITRKVRNYTGYETITLGSYSMAPGISSEDKVN